MKKMFKTTAAFLATVTLAAGVTSMNAFAEEATEPTEAATTVADTTATDTSADTTEPGSTAPVAIIAEVSCSVWSGGDHTASFSANDYDADLGAFVGITTNSTLTLDDSNSVVAVDGGNVTVTIKESCLKTLEAGKYYFNAQFEKGSITPVFGVEIPEKATTVADANNNSAASDSAPSVGSPKTGSKDIGGVLGLLAFSAAGAMLLKKRK